MLGPDFGSYKAPLMWGRLLVGHTMKATKVLADLVNSATGAKTHFDVWWAQVSDAKPQFAVTMNEHVDFFIASQDAHYTACFVYLAHLFDKRSDSSSLPTYLTLVRDETESSRFKDIEVRYAALAKRAEPLVLIRHKTIAHIDARLTENDVCAPLNITWYEIRSIIHDAATLVEDLAGAPHRGAVGIPRDNRLIEATTRLIHALKERGAYQAVERRISSKDH